MSLSEMVKLGLNPMFICLLVIKFSLFRYNLLGCIADTLEFTELFPSEKVDMHVDPFLHGSNVGEELADAEERFSITSA